MKRIATSPRTCLGCDKTFPSTGPGNRICPKCTATNRTAHDKRTTNGHTGRSGGLTSST